MQTDLKKNWLGKRGFCLGLLILVLFSLALRIPNLTLLPVFHDQAFYIRWAQIIADNPTDIDTLFISKVNGKQPLSFWFLASIVGTFEDPLLTERSLAVFFGTCSLIGVALTARRMFGDREALVTAGIYAFLPYSVFFERVASIESMLGCFSVFSLFFAVSLVLEEKNKWLYAVLLGLTLGLGFWGKSPFLTVAILCLLVPLFYADDRRRNYRWMSVSYALFAVFLGVFYYLNGRAELPDFGHNPILITPKQFYNPWQDPRIIRDNLIQTADCLTHYLTWPLLFVILYGAAAFYGEKGIGLAFLWFLFPVLIVVFFVSEVFSRYFFFVIFPLTLVAGRALVRLTEWEINSRPVGRNAFPAVMLLIFFTFTPFSIAAIEAPQRLPLPERDREQFVEDWPSGYGIREIVLFIRERQKQRGGKTLVLTTLDWGIPGDAIEMYLRRDKDVTVRIAWWYSKQEPVVVPDDPLMFRVINNKFQRKFVGWDSIGNYRDVYFVLQSNEDPKGTFHAANANLVPVKRLDKLKQGVYFVVYQLRR